MSNVKMCDDCGAIFADTTPGISGGSAFDADTGRQSPLDFCPDCTTVRKTRRSGMTWRRQEDQPKALDGSSEP